MEKAPPPPEMAVLGGELLVSCSLLLLYEPEFWGAEVLVLSDGRPQAWVSKHLPKAGHHESWGRSVGERASDSDVLCFKFPGAHVLCWLEAVGG